MNIVDRQELRLVSLSRPRGVGLDNYQPDPGKGDLCGDCRFKSVDDGLPACLARFPNLKRYRSRIEECTLFEERTGAGRRRSGQLDRPPLGFHNVRTVHIFPDK